MKKKIKDITIKEYLSYCSKEIIKDCKNCVFNAKNNGGLDNRCISMIDLGIINLNKEIDVEEEKTCFERVSPTCFVERVSPNVEIYRKYWGFEGEENE